GVVYAANDSARNALVAVKLLCRADPSSIYRFKQEFRALSDLSHPNLIKMYELLCERDQWLFTMEFVDGVDFLSYVRGIRAKSDSSGHSAVPGITEPNTNSPPFDLARLHNGAVQLADGLHALHMAGKLHRDLKPSNVLVTAESRVVILDFGLVSELTP